MKAMVSIRQSGEFTNEKLTLTQNIVDAMALFSVKKLLELSEGITIS